MFSFRKDIQLYRALAVVLVIFAHLHPLTFKNYIIGVDLFFVISGFVITQSMLNNFIDNKFTLSVFYAKRIVRILPLSFIVALISLIIFNIVSPSSFKSYEFLTSAFGLQNLFLYFSGISYGGTGASYNPFTHYWSLGIEEQFYLIYPFVFVLFVSVSRNISKFKLIKRFVFVLIAFTLLSFIYYSFGINSDKLLYYSPFSRAWELLLGCISAIAVRLTYIKSQKMKSMVISTTSMSLKLLLSVCLLLLALKSFSYYTLLIITVSSFSVLIYIDSFNKITSLNLLDNTAVKRIFSGLILLGNISFSVYIIHWPLLLLLKVFIQLENNYLFFDSIYLTLLISLSLLSYNFIEKSFKLNSSYRISFRPFYLYLSSILSAFLIFVPSQYSKHFKNLLRPLNPNGTYFSKQFADEETVPGALPCSWGYQDSFQDLSDFKRLSNCIASQINAVNNRSIYLVGDSHSTSLTTSIKNVSSKLDYNYIKIAHVYCPFRKSYTMNWSASSPVQKFSCSNFNKAIEQYLDKNIRSGDILILAFRDSFYFSDLMPISIEHKNDFVSGFTAYNDEKGNIISRKKVAHETLEGIHLLSSKLDSKGAKLLLVLQGHENKNPIFYCDHSLSHLRSDCSISKNLFLVPERNYFRAKLLSGETSINYFDLLNYTCTDSECMPLSSDSYIFRDDDHITAEFANRNLTPFILNFIGGIK